MYEARGEFAVVRTAVTIEGGAPVGGPTPGPPCPNHAKGRAILITKCDAGDFEKIATAPGVQGCILTTFAEGHFALVFKQKSFSFKQGLNLSN